MSPFHDAQPRAPRRSTTQMPSHSHHPSRSLRSSTPWRAISLVVALLALVSSRAVHGAFRGRSIGSRRISGRGIGPRPGDRVGVGKRKLLHSQWERQHRARKLLDDDDDDDETFGRRNGHCVSAYETLRRRPDLRTLFEIVQSLPVIRAKLQDPTKVYTLFAPNNEAIASLKAWEGWIEAKNMLVEAFGSDRLMRAYMLAYHAVAGQALTKDDLLALRGDDIYLEDYLNNVFPLVVNATADGVVRIDGFGSSVSIVEADIFACEAVVHVVDAVLLPFDGDDVLDDVQIAQLREATRALRERYDVPAPEPTDADGDGDIDEWERAGAVPIESVPTEWTKDAIDDANDD